MLERGVNNILPEDNDNINNSKDKVLIDKSATGKIRPWDKKKLSTFDLSESYKRLNINKYYRVAECGSFLEFRRYNNNDLKLHNANFCKVRLCPMCSWRRSLKIYGQVSKVMDKAMELHNYDFIFLTLTCRNVESKILSDTIDNLFKSFDRLTKRSKFKKSIKGYFRALEVTHNLENDTYHPHFHVVLAVNKSYFTDVKIYITQEEWTSLWKNSLKIDYTPIVDVRKFQDRKGKGITASIAETAKYTVKDTDYLVRDTHNILDEEETDKAVLVLDTSLAYRRLTSFGGILKVIHKELNLDDVEDGDLINTDNDDEIRDDLNYIIERYCWNIGYKQYTIQY